MTAVAPFLDMPEWHPTKSEFEGSKRKHLLVLSLLSLTKRDVCTWREFRRNAHEFYPLGPGRMAACSILVDTAAGLYWRMRAMQEKGTRVPSVVQFPNKACSGMPAREVASTKNPAFSNAMNRASKDDAGYYRHRPCRRARPHRRNGNMP